MYEKKGSATTTSSEVKKIKRDLNGFVFFLVFLSHLPLLTVFDSASTKSIFDILEERRAHMAFVASSSFVMPLSSCLISKLLLLLPLFPSLRLRSSSKELPIELDTLRFEPELSLSSVRIWKWNKLEVSEFNTIAFSARIEISAMDVSSYTRIFFISVNASYFAYLLPTVFLVCWKCHHR